MGGGRAGVTNPWVARGAMSGSHGRGLRTPCCVTCGLGAVHGGFDNGRR